MSDTEGVSGEAREAARYDRTVAATAPETYLDDLNPAQREAVLTTEGPLLVIAGAGSGKTRVLTRRIAHLLAAVGVKPPEILAITFTNKAAAEMRERVADLVGPPARGAWVMTFHAACGRILRREAQRLGYRSNFTIYDQADQIRLTKQCLEELDRDPKRFTPHAAIRWPTRWVSTRVLPEPAPAITSSGPSVARTASRWAGFRSSRYVSGVVAATRRS